MLKQIKNSAILIIVTFYVLQSSSVFTLNLIANIQEIRNQIQISKIHLAEIIEVDNAFWNNQKNKKEIKINNHYYDIVSHTIVAKKVFLKAVKDNDENNLATLFNELLEEDESNSLEKKKSSESSKILFFFSSEKLECITTFDLKPQKKPLFEASKKPSKIALSLFKPPC